MSRRATVLEKHNSLDELEDFAAICSDVKVYRRVTSIIAIKKGESWTDAAKRGYMSLDVLCFWVKRYNKSGFDGLKNKKSSGRPPKLKADQTAQLIKIVKDGPNPEIDCINRWRLYDLVGIIVKMFGVKLSESSVWYMLKREGFSTQSPRPRHPKQNPDDIPAFKRDFRQLVKDKTAHVPEEIPRQVWFQDEARIGEKNNRAKIWAPVGERPIVLADMGYQVGYLLGAVCPELGKAVGLVMPCANAVTMQMLVECISEEITDQAHGVIIMDCATWHTTKKLKIPDNMTIIYLPPYCPELNSIEQIWSFLRKNYLSNHIYGSWDSLVEAICLAWNKLRELPEKITEISTRKWAILT